MQSKPSSRKSLGDATVESITKLRRTSKLSRDGSDVQEIAWDDVQETEIVGKGGFAEVYKIKLKKPDSPRVEKKKKYALKRLDARKLKALDDMDPSESTIDMEDSGKFELSAAMHLAMEGEILASLRHKNIVRLHGATSGGPGKAFNEDEKGYFLVLDLLKETLQDRLQRYRRKLHQPKGLFQKSREDSQSSVVKRLNSVAIGVARGMAYLHENGVVLRDLKPENIGFDEYGTPKIFDFGFAREVHSVDSGMTGSLRYMAPEVALARGAKLSSDVYSYGVILWEITTLESAFNEFENKPKKFVEEVVVGGWRPSLASIDCLPLKRLINSCWFANPSVRPPFSHIVRSLETRVKLSEVPIIPGRRERKRKANLRKNMSAFAKKIGFPILQNE